MIKVGTLFAGRYGIISQIGSGGMADVYKVQDVETNRTIALKVLKESLSRDADSIRRFKAEGERMKEIQSQNVVTVYDVGSVGGTYYIAMELINGITLKEYIRRKGQLSPKETMAVSAQVACGLRAAHSRQIVHRDVKPQNIILSKDGKVKVMDFGIAESTDAGAKNSQFTVGSVYYIAPEQAKGEACDERSDIYSLGVVMYEMITGKVPFDKETTVQVALAHMNESMTPPSELNPECPLALEQIIFRCTQKSRARRYHNCTELLGDLKIAVGTPDYDFGQKEKATLMKNNTQVFTKNEPRPKPVAPMTGDVRRPRPTRQSAHEEEDETEVRAAHKPAKKPLPKTLFDRIIQILGAIIAAVILFLLIYIIVSFSGCNKKPVQQGSSQAPVGSSEEDDITLATKHENDFNPATDARVPQCIGLPLQDAIKALEDAGLGYKLSSAVEYSEEFPLGTIIKQSYNEGTVVEKGSTIVIMMSGGSDKFEILQSYIGKSVKLFRDNIAKLSQVINVSYKSQFSDTVNANIVMQIIVNGQAITQDTQVHSGDTVQVIYSAGKKDVTMPQLVGLSKDEAIKKIEAAGLVCKESDVSYEYSDTVAEGIVMTQSYTQGSSVKNGTAIKITVSHGKEKKEVSVPAVNGKTLEEYKKALTDAGLTIKVVYIYSTTETNGTIKTVSPTAGTTVQTGAEVTVTAYTTDASQAESVKIPAYTPDQDAATTLVQSLKDKGLTVETKYIVTEEVTKNMRVHAIQDESGNVKSANSSVPAGSTVTVVVNSYIPPTVDKIAAHTTLSAMKEYLKAQNPQLTILETQSGESTEGEIVTAVQVNGATPASGMVFDNKITLIYTKKVEAPPEPPTEPEATEAPETTEADPPEVPQE